MSKKTNNNRFVTGTKNIDQQDQTNYRKCAHHVYSHNYAANMRQNYEITEKLASDKISSVDMNSTINIKIVFHFLAPKGSYNRERVLSRAHDIILSINDDFNNYTTNQNTMNNFKYKSIINQVFLSNMPKQNTYLGQKYLDYLPTKPSNIIFELGEIYYYPVKSRLTLSQYDDIKDVEIEFQLIKQFIYRNRADAIYPDSVLNIWIIDMSDTSILGFSNFPWEIIDNYHGIILHRRAFFPEDYGETNFSTFKSFTHQIGHFFGLIHVVNSNSGIGAYIASNINMDSEEPLTNMTDDDYIANTPEQLYAAYDPTDKNINKSLHQDGHYNPLFMNFMDYTYDKYVSMFTPKQIQIMRFIILTHRPKINSSTSSIKLPIPRYNPDTDTISGVINSKNSSYIMRPPPLIPSYEAITNPRYVGQDYMMQRPQIPQPVVKKQPPVNAPNLFANESANAAATTKEQIIANIQNIMPKDSPESKMKEKINSYEDMIKNYKSYTSNDGYASLYPHDPFMKQYNNQIQMMQQQFKHMMKDNGADTDSKLDINIDIDADPSMVDPRMMDPRMTDPRMMDPRMTDPRMTDPRMMDPRMMDPRMAANVDPRMTDPRMTDPRMTDPRMTDPRMTDPRMAANVDPRMMDPRMTDPRMTDPRMTDPRMTDPRMTDPRMMDPRMADPRMAANVDPRMMDPRMTDPRMMNPRMADPRMMDPRMMDPRMTDPRMMDPRMADPRMGANVDPKIIDLRKTDSRMVDPISAPRIDPKLAAYIDPKFQNTRRIDPIFKDKKNELTTDECDEQDNPSNRVENANDVPVPNNQQPDFGNRIERINDQLNNIKSRIPANFSQNSFQKINDPQKYNKFGQFKSSQPETKIMNPKNFKRRFTRSRPINVAAIN
ncbi:MAG: putative bifunctional metalloprotease/ubiquitin-protein ligase [Satyrvirus sp.]|uniref:Putative bifunctional metalloprotease/ubiquitin-protein ligase n=1 Tax=Satyrvirus sp. TaxID=2487771 RepID=A0A3G5AEG6_9VIRU|nr:MAG: putative bifunctional metalloprotease/ubiquitin-protein ligase [Satyrvirus sp.]